MPLSVSAPSPPRRISVKHKEKSRLVLQWRKREETNGIIKKYVLHFSDSDGAIKTYTMHSGVDKEYVTYEVTLPDVETEYKIKVSEKQKKKQSKTLDKFWLAEDPFIRLCPIHTN